MHLPCVIAKINISKQRNDAKFMLLMQILRIMFLRFFKYDTYSQLTKKKRRKKKEYRQYYQEIIISSSYAIDACKAHAISSERRHV